MEETSDRLWNVERIDSRWVSDGLKNHFKTWTHQRPVLLNAPTGHGKNTFIMKTLIPYAMETGQHVFLFSNRIALNDQQKKELLNTLKIPYVGKDDVLRNTESFSPMCQYAPDPRGALPTVNVLSYQSAWTFLDRIQQPYNVPLGTLLEHRYQGYAVFDEAHFFLSDALFNAYTQMIFERLLFAFSYFTRIYMTATSDNILPIISQYEINNDNKFLLTYKNLRKQGSHCASHGDCNVSNNTNGKLRVYEFPQDYTNYNVTFFSDIKQLYDEIKRTSGQKEKWLFFINSKTRQQDVARNLYTEVSDSLKVDCFDSSKKNDPKLWELLINGDIPHDVLLTTSALDNGVNITDPALHHIVLECTDKVSFMQMMGRKRRKDGEKINLYVYSPKKEAVEKMYLEADKLLATITDFIIDEESFLQQKSPSRSFLQRRWPDFHQKYRNLFWISSDNNGQRLVLNCFAKAELEIRKGFYSDLLLKMQEVNSDQDALDVYPKQVLEWLGLPQDIQWVNAHGIEAAKAELLKLLEQYEESGIPQDKHEEFFNEFARLADVIYNGAKTVPKDFRSGPSVMSRALRDLTQILGVSYEIKGKGTWKIIKLN